MWIDYVLTDYLEQYLTEFSQCNLLLHIDKLLVYTYVKMYRIYPSGRVFPGDCYTTGQHSLLDFQG